MDFGQAAPQANDNFKKCPYCPRTFNEQAAEKHFPHCEKKFKLEQMKQKGNKNKLGGTAKPVAASTLLGKKVSNTYTMQGGLRR